MLDIPTTYCEQLSRLGWEPLNVISSVAFIALGIYAAYVLRTQGVLLRWLLPLQMVLVGAGSVLWHTTHSPFGDFADTFAVAVFAFTASFILLRRLALSLPRVVLLLVSLAVVTLFVEQSALLNGSLAYVVLCAAYGYSGMRYVKKFPFARNPFFVSLIVFGAAILFRSVDMYFCTVFPAGLHFLWHVLIATFCLLFTLLLVKRN